jgi:hypothetical protein
MKKLLSILFLLPLFALAGTGDTVNYTMADGAPFSENRTHTDQLFKTATGAWFATISLDGSTTPSLNGTTITIASGTYTGGTIQNLHDVIIDGSAATITGTLNMGSLTRATMNNFNINNVSGAAVSWHGNNQVIREHKWNVWKTGDVNDASYNQAYNGSISTLNMYYFRMDSCTVRGAGYLMMGSFGAPGGNVAFMDSVQFDHNNIRNTSGNGIQYRGDCWRLGYTYNYTLYDSTTNLGYGVDPVLGDVGENYLYGSGTVHDNYRRGGRGYTIRLWPLMLNGRYDTTKIYNNVQVCTWTYGFSNTAANNFDGAGTSTGTYTQYGGQVKIWNNTLAHVGDDIGYWCPGLAYGNMDNAGTGTTVPVYFHNNLIAESVEQGDANYTGQLYSSNQYGKNKALVDQSNGNHPDTANNRHYIRIAGVVDTLTGNRLITINDGSGNPIGANLGAVVNQPPAIDIQPAAPTITLPTNFVTLNSSGSFDPDGTIASRLWSQVSGPNTATLTSTTATSLTASNLIAGTYTFKLVATDNSGATTSKNVSVLVKAANVAPVANISPAGTQNIFQPANSIHLDGSGSTDDGTIVSYSWTGTGPGPALPVFSNSSTPQVDVTGLTSQGIYTVTLTVIDNNGAANAITQQIIVNVAGTVNKFQLILHHGGRIIFK